MDRSQAGSLGISVIGHAVLLAVLTYGMLRTDPVSLPLNEPVEISLVDEVGLQSAAPVINPDPATSRAPDLGQPEDAPPPAPAPEPEPAPTPKPVAKPLPTTASVKPAPAPLPKAAVKPAPAKPLTKPATTPGKADSKSGSNPASTAKKPTGALFGDSFLKGLSDKPSKSTNAAPKAATVGAQELSNIQSVIARRIQPCANTRRNPGPGANRIKTKLRLQFNKDGSLAAKPALVSQTGVDGDNLRYADRVADLAIGAVVECAPISGLPPELYKTANGQGWNDIFFNYSLPN